MSKTLQIIKAIKELDFNKLTALLEDDGVYFEMKKKWFLFYFEKYIQDIEGFDRFEEVKEGVCRGCIEGCQGIKFSAKNRPSLSVIFEMENGRIKEIKECKKLEVDGVLNENDSKIFFHPYMEEKVGFVPSFFYMSILREMKSAVQKFDDLENLAIVPMDSLISWYDGCKELYEKSGLDKPYARMNIKGFRSFASLYLDVKKLVESFYENGKRAIDLDELLELDIHDEREIVSWLLRKEEISFWSLEKTENWETTGLMKFNTRKTLFIDCKDWIETFHFMVSYDAQFNRIMDKYFPKDGDQDVPVGGLEYSLESCLKFRGKYLDLI